MVRFRDQHRELSTGADVGFFRIDGAIAGDFPVCVVPSTESDATIVAPLILGALLECRRHPDEARALVASRPA